MRKNLISEFFGLFLLISAMVASLGIGAVVSARTGIEDKGVPLILSGLLKSHSGEIQDQSVFFQEEMAGFWMLFIHFSEATQTVDMVLDSKGNIIQSSDPSLAGKSLLIGKNGNFYLIGSDEICRIHTTGRTLFRWYGKCKGYRSSSIFSVQNFR